MAGEMADAVRGLGIEGTRKEGETSMIILGIETAGPTGSVALVDTVAGTTRQVLLPASRQLGADLAPVVARLLTESGLGPDRAPDLVAVDLGPGSYTGLRIGLAAAKGLCFAWGRPLLGVAAVEALAEEAMLGQGATDVVVAMDASRGQVHAARFGADPRAGAGNQGIVRTVSADLWDPAELREALVKGGPVPALVGDAAAAVADPARGLVATGPLWPTAERIARVAHARHCRGERDDALRLVPIYFHANEAEETRRKRSMKATVGNSSS